MENITAKSSCLQGILTTMTYKRTTKKYIFANIIEWFCFTIRIYNINISITSYFFLWLVGLNF